MKPRTVRLHLPACQLQLIMHESGRRSSTRSPRRSVGPARLQPPRTRTSDARDGTVKHAHGAARQRGRDHGRDAANPCSSSDRPHPAGFPRRRQGPVNGGSLRRPDRPPVYQTRDKVLAVAIMAAVSMQAVQSGGSGHLSQRNIGRISRPAAASLTHRRKSAIDVSQDRRNA
jgi:hypothetical protein